MDPVARLLTDLSVISRDAIVAVSYRPKAKNTWQVQIDGVETAADGSFLAALTSAYDAVVRARFHKAFDALNDEAP